MRILVPPNFHLADFAKIYVGKNPILAVSTIIRDSDVYVVVAMAVIVPNDIAVAWVNGIRGNQVTAPVTMAVANEEFRNLSPDFIVYSKFNVSVPRLSRRMAKKQQIKSGEYGQTLLYAHNVSYCCLNNCVTRQHNHQETSNVNLDGFY
jgi:hypothetical protein